LAEHASANQAERHVFCHFDGRKRKPERKNGCTSRFAASSELFKGSC
jgi:hypothetical protein